MTRRLAALLAVLVVLVAGCGPTSQLAWRDLELVLPDGWVVVDRLDTALYVGNGPQGDEGERGDLDVGVQLSVEPATVADDWRELVSSRGGTIDRDETMTVGGLPATLLQFTMLGDADTPATRERVVLVPSRQLVMLAQAVPVQGQTDGPEVFDAHVDEIDQLIASIDFGAPADYGND